QKTVNIETKENDTLEVQGRHDPSIVPRAIVVVEAATAIVILDKMLEAKKYGVNN
ncbi:MAG: chorismate synthase, partial [Leptotrichiaceae bacterium]